MAIGSFSIGAALARQGSAKLPGCQFLAHHIGTVGAGPPPFLVVDPDKQRDQK